MVFTLAVTIYEAIDSIIYNRTMNPNQKPSIG
jgi:hypothetical protein